MKAVYRPESYRAELIGTGECGDSNLITKTRIFFEEPLKFLNSADVPPSTIFCKGEKDMRFDLLPYEKKIALFDFMKLSEGFSYLRKTEVDVLKYVVGAQISVGSEYGCNDEPIYDKYKTPEGTRGSDFEDIPCRSESGPLDVKIVVTAKGKVLNEMSLPTSTETQD